jgi:hypothetical protein
MWTACTSTIEGNLFPLWSNTAFRLTLDEATKFFILQRCVQVAVLPFILWCYSSTLYHHPRVTLCYVWLPLPTERYYYTFLKEIPLLKPWSKRLRLLFCRREKMSVCLASLWYAVWKFLTANSRSAKELERSLVTLRYNLIQYYSRYLSDLNK